MLNLNKNILRLYAFKFFVSLHFIGGVLVPFFLDWGRITYIQMMFLQTWFVFWFSALEAPTGAIADYLGRKTTIALGAFSIVIAAIVYSSYPNFYIFLLGEFLWALSGALISGADVALIYDTLKETGQEKKSKKVLGRYNSFNLWGIAIAAPIGSLIGGLFGLQYAIRAMAIPFFIAGIIAFTIKEPRYRKKETEESYIKTLTGGIRYFFKHKLLRVLAFDYISIYVLSFFIIWTYQPLLLNLGLPLAFVGTIHSISAFFEILIMNNFHNLERLMKSKKNYLFFSAILISASFLILSVSGSIILTAILSILIFGFGFTRKTLYNHYMNKFIDSDNRATVLSAISMTESFARAIMYPLIGIVLQFSLNIGVLVIGVLIFFAAMFSRVEEHMLID
ncbi:MFS transporter [Candidatus Woesearchaeota archaeon]|nr:MFS transporter [Candidatus Woesearchaeota archaeon]